MSALKLGVFCGGPSGERGISLNSARSILDHLSAYGVQIYPVYVDKQKQFHALLPSQLYSNTPSDFDFKLEQLANPLTIEQLERYLKEVDLVFPAIHGAFGEDGQLQNLLDRWQVPYIGPSGDTCRHMYFKNLAAEKLKANGFVTLPSCTIYAREKRAATIVQVFFEEHRAQRAVVKPVAGGSSLGVSVVDGPQHALQCMEKLFKEGHEQVLLEAFCLGREFTTLVLQNERGVPVALVPTEIEMNDGEDQIFDYRRKYLPTNNTTYHTPPRFDSEVVLRIQKEAEKIFKVFKMRDFARIDGWLLEDGRLLFTDLNPISGMEQNSFLFRQSSVVGLSHASVLLYIVEKACRRHGIDFFPSLKEEKDHRQPVYVLFGGGTAERQVSLMSGTNVWLKLRSSDKFRPTPYFMDKSGDVWQLPYAFALNHTVEEVFENCQWQEAQQNFMQKIASHIQEHLGYFLKEADCKAFQAQRLSLSQFIRKAKNEEAFVFLALHGGDGENGVLQKKLEEAEILFNGSGSVSSALCMDKYQTGMAVHKMKELDIRSLPRCLISAQELSAIQDMAQAEKLWDEFKIKLEAPSFIIKPRYDGCSAGIVKIIKPEDIITYSQLICAGAPFIPAHKFKGQPQIVEMPSAVEEFMVEPFIETDILFIDGKQMVHRPQSGWIELTVGVLESEGAYESLLPSVTVAESGILSLEEKFQGGTGVNITPPPEGLFTSQQVLSIQRRIEKIVQALGVENYARIDVFVHRQSSDLIVIEVNSLPGLTPSTVIYHQALAHSPSMAPKAFLEKIIESKKPTLFKKCAQDCLI